MANWTTKLEIGDLYKQLDDEAISHSDAGHEIAKRLEVLRQEAGNDFSYWHKGRLLDIRNAFMEVEDVDDHDDAMEMLYDWGDVDHTCWINTRG